MTNEEARAYFIDCNERIMSVAKDENIYNYETQQVEDVFMRRTFEANELAIKALEQEPHETVTEFADRCRECGAYYGRLLNQKWTPISEGPPKENETVIASTKYGVYPEAKYTKEYGWEWLYEAGTEYWIELEDVEAWMPLPEPYKAEGSEE